MRRFVRVPVGAGDGVWIALDRVVSVGDDGPQRCRVTLDAGEPRVVMVHGRSAGEVMEMIEGEEGR